MATFQKGKGTRKRAVTLKQVGALIMKDEIDGVSQMLTGYWRLSSEKAARDVILRESMSLIAAGLAPIDKAAEEIAALVPKKNAAKKPALPIRKDVYVYNEATGMMVTSRRMAGKDLEEGSSEWMKAVKKGDFLPLSLVQDDPFTVRVVVDGKLEAAEQDEWVARVDWHLNVKDGKLCITGGAPLISADYEDDDSYIEQFVREIEIPKGHYRATLYSYIPGVNGTAPLDELAGGYGKAEPIGKWFRRTRAKEPFPTWLREWCIGDPAIDPGHERDWQGKKLLDDRDWPDYIHFLVHLVAVKGAPKKGLSQPPEGGWFDMSLNARMPVRCPLGLKGQEMSGRKCEPTGSWIFSQDAFKLCNNFQPRQVADGPVSLSLNNIAASFQLAWFRTRMAFPGMRAKLPKGGTVCLEEIMPEGVVLAPDGDMINFVFSNDIEPASVITTAEKLSGFLATFPDGTELEVSFAPPENLPGTRPEAGTSRFQGTLRGGHWHIASIFPPGSTADLSGALSLARETLEGKYIRVADADEGKEILAKAKRKFRFLVEDNPGELQGDLIRLGKKDSNTLSFYGAAAFELRYADSWLAGSFLALDEESEVDEVDEDGAPWDLEGHVRGPEVYCAPGGRVYCETMALLASEKLAEKVRAEEPKLKGIRFYHVADVLCDQFQNVAVRGYVQAKGRIWASLLVGVPDTVVLEMSSRFADGALLVTSRAPQAGDEVGRKMYRTHLPDASARELFAKHEERLRELESFHGAPLEVVQSAEGLAREIESAIVAREN